MRKNKKPREKKNIFDEDEDDEPTSQPSQTQPKSEPKGDWVNGIYDPAKYQENEMYINRRHKEEEHTFDHKPPESNSTPKKKIATKKKKLFDSDEDSNEDPKVIEQAKPLREEQAKPHREELIPAHQKSEIFENSEDEEPEDEELENQEDSAARRQYESQIKGMAQKQAGKAKEINDESMSYSEIFEKAGKDRVRMKRLIYEPVPKNCKATCVFKRISSGFSETYQLLLEDERAIMFCENQRGSIGANYYISLTKEMNKKNTAYLGKLRGNASGSVYQLYDSGEQPDKSMNRKGWRVSMGKIQYESNFLGMNGPRKLTAVIPTAETLEDLDSFKFSQNEDISQFTPPKVIKFRNKHPRWNERLKSYALNFGGRVKEASIKNFILLDQQVPEREQFSAPPTMVFGKIDENNFSLEAFWPLSLYQAFGIAVSAFDFKLNCE